MAAQESRLVIAIDATKAQQQAKALDSELKKLNTSGNNASKSIKGFGDSAKSQSSNLSSFTQNLRQLTNQAGTFATAIAGAGVALTAFSASYANSVKEMVNLSRLADSNTTEFQRMAVAASSYGVTQEQLADQIKDFNEKLGEFILTGKGEGVDAFETLHKHAKMTTAEISKFALEMQKASGPQALVMYVEKLEEAGVSQEQMSFLVENMGNDLTKLLPILRNGGEELNRLANEAQRLGVILDEEAIAQALELEKQIKLLKMQTQGITNQFMSGLMPALTQIAKAMLGASGQGEQFNIVGQAVGKTMLWLAKVGTGVAATFNIVGTAIGGAVAAMSDEGVTHQMVIDDLKGMVNDYGNTLNSLEMPNQDKLKNELAEARERANKELSQIGTGQGITAGLNTFAEDMGKESKAAADKVASEAKRAADAAIREGNRAAEEIANLRNEFSYKYSDFERKVELDLQEELLKIRKAGLGKGYEDAAKNAATLQKKIYNAQLEYELNEFKMSEKQKLEERLKINRLLVLAETETTNPNKDKKLKSLNDAYNLEALQIDLAKQKRLHAVREQFLDETTAMQERYRLERAEIILIRDSAERTATLQYNKMKERAELLDGMRKAQDEWEAKKPNSQRNNPYNQADDNRREQLNASGAVYRAGMADIANREQNPNADFAALNAEKEALMQTHTQNMLAIETAYEQARVDLNLSYGEQIAGSMSSMFKTMMGEQSSAYKAMFAIEKGFALARATLNFTSAYAAAFNDPTALTTTQKFANYAALAAAGSQIISTLASIKPTGFANGGYTGNGGKHEVAGLVHKGEVVFSQADVKNAGGVQAVENLRKYGTGSSGVSVSIENYGTSKDFEVQQIDENQIRIIARDEAQKTVVSDLRNPNSKISSTLKQTKNVVERR